MSTKTFIKKAQEKITFFNVPQLIQAGLIPLKGEYFPSIYYPPITMYPPSSEDEIFDHFKYKTEDPMALYIHIPFCPTKCVYCHWVTS